MRVSCSPAQLHQTNDKWNMYYHLPTNKDWSLNSYTIIAKNIDCIETVIKINEELNDSIIKKLYAIRHERKYHSNVGRSKK